MAQGKLHYAWLVLVACLGFYSLIYGALATTLGVFFVPVMAETGWSRTAATAYTYIQPLVSAVCAVPAARLFDRFNPRWLLSACVAAHGVAYVAPAFLNELWVWDLYGVVFGAFASFVLYLAVPSLVNQWFAKKVGFAVGFAAAGISVFAAIGNPIASLVIQEWGWCAARIGLGVSITAVALLLTVAFVRPSPERMGLRPYGAEGGSVAPTEAAPREGVPAKAAMRSASFYLIMFSICCFIMCTPLGQQLASYGEQGSSLGATAGALGISVVSAVAVLGKIGLGWFSDRFGVSPVARFSCVTGMAGPLCMLAGGTMGSVALFLVGAGIFGVGYSSMTVLGPLAVREAFGTRDYNAIYARITSVVFVFGALGNFLYALIYDVTGSYAGMFVMPAALYALCLIILPLGVRIGRNLRAQAGSVERTVPWQS